MRCWQIPIFRDKRCRPNAPQYRTLARSRTSRIVTLDTKEPKAMVDNNHNRRDMYHSHTN